MECRREKMERLQIAVHLFTEPEEIPTRRTKNARVNGRKITSVCDNHVAPDSPVQNWPLYLLNKMATDNRRPCFATGYVTAQSLLRVRML